MALNRDHAIQLHLGGTVALPGPFPETGEIRLDRNGVKFELREAEQVATAALIVVKHLLSARRETTMFVMADDARALCHSPDPDNPEQIEWWIGPEVIHQLQSRDGPVTGILFVKESGQLVQRLSEGTTAAAILNFTVPSSGGGRNPVCEHFTG